LSIGLGSFLVALALVVAVGVGSAIAVIPNNGTYSACLTKATGEIRVINYPKVKCAKGEKLIKWNAKGPAGPQGAQGPQGEQGPKGDQGPAGPADWNATANIPAGFKDGVDNVGFKSTVIIDTLVGGSPLGGNSTAQIVAGAISGNSVLTVEPLTADGMLQIQNLRAELDGGGNPRFRFDLVNVTPKATDYRLRIVDFGAGPNGLTNAQSKAKVGKGVRIVRTFKNRSK
jgi:hypothetical protein